MMKESFAAVEDASRGGKRNLFRVFAEQRGRNSPSLSKQQLTTIDQASTPRSRPASEADAASDTDRQLKSETNSFQSMRSKSNAFRDPKVREEVNRLFDLLSKLSEKNKEMRSQSLAHDGSLPYASSVESDALKVHTSPAAHTLPDQNVALLAELPPRPPAVATHLSSARQPAQQLTAFTPTSPQHQGALTSPISIGNKSPSANLSKVLEQIASDAEMTTDSSLTGPKEDNNETEEEEEEEEDEEEEEEQRASGANPAAYPPPPPPSPPPPPPSAPPRPPKSTLHQLPPPVRAHKRIASAAEGVVTDDEDNDPLRSPGSNHSDHSVAAESREGGRLIQPPRRRKQLRSPSQLHQSRGGVDQQRNPRQAAATATTDEKAVSLNSLRLNTHQGNDDDDLDSDASLGRDVVRSESSDELSQMMRTAGGAQSPASGEHFFCGLITNEQQQSQPKRFLREKDIDQVLVKLDGKDLSPKASSKQKKRQYRWTFSGWVSQLGESLYETIATCDDENQVAQIRPIHTVETDDHSLAAVDEPKKSSSKTQEGSVRSKPSLIEPSKSELTSEEKASLIEEIRNPNPSRTQMLQIYERRASEPAWSIHENQEEPQGTDGAELVVEVRDDTEECVERDQDDVNCHRELPRETPSLNMRLRRNDNDDSSLIDTMTPTARPQAEPALVRADSNGSYGDYKQRTKSFFGRAKRLVTPRKYGRESPTIAKHDDDDRSYTKDYADDELKSPAARSRGSIRRRTPKKKSPAHSQQKPMKSLYGRARKLVKAKKILHDSRMRQQRGHGISSPQQSSEHLEEEAEEEEPQEEKNVEKEEEAEAGPSEAKNEHEGEAGPDAEDTDETPEPKPDPSADGEGEKSEKERNDTEESYTLGYLLGTLACQEEKQKGKRKKGDNGGRTPAKLVIPKNSTGIQETKRVVEELGAKGMPLKTILQTLKKNPEQQPRLARGYLTYVLMQFASRSDNLDHEALQRGFQKRLGESSKQKLSSRKRGKSSPRQQQRHHPSRYRRHRSDDEDDDEEPPLLATASRLHYACSPLHCGICGSKDNDIDNIEGQFDTLIIAVESSLASLRNESLSMTSSLGSASSDDASHYRFRHIDNADAESAGDASFLSDIESWFAFLSESGDDSDDDSSEDDKSKKSDSSSNDYGLDMTQSVLRD